LEEANIEIYNLKFLTILEDVVSWYISFYVLADYKEGILSGNTDERIENLKWNNINSLPKKLYLPFKRFSTWENIHEKNIYELLKGVE
jgi:hypothetical protein